MSTITSLAAAGGATMGTRMWKATPVVYSNVIDFAAALTAKGSALAAADIIEAIRLPAGVIIQAAGLQTMVVDDATTLTLDFGLKGGDTDGFVDGYDQAAAAAGDYATSLFDTSEIQVIYPTANSLDIILATLTGTLTVGKVRAWAVVVDVTGSKQPGTATFTG